jgi:hypothetical protein
MVVRLLCRLKLAGVHGDRWTDRLYLSQLIPGIPLGAWGLPLPPLRRVVINLSGSTSNARASSGDNAGTELPDSGLRTSRHFKGNSKDQKNERPIHRALTRGRFEALANISEVIERLFG